jgi:hypothetical protein
MGREAAHQHTGVQLWPVFIQPAQRHDLEQARREIEGYVAVIFQLHEE